MKNKLPENVKNIIYTLTNNGYEAYVVGGACRDYLLGVEPKDFDITTNAKAEDIQRLFPQAVTGGNHFCVSFVDRVEVASYRKDQTYCAEVVNTIEEDVVRRDFTINAIVYDLVSNRFTDYTRGSNDIRDKILCFVGEPERRIKEDPVRILRGIRFASLYNLTIEEETFFAMFQHRKLLKEVAGERIQLEVIKAFKGRNTHRFLTMLNEMEMLEFVFPSLMKLKGIDGGGFHNESVFSHSLNAVKAIEGAKWALKLAALYHDIGKTSPELNAKGLNSFRNHNIMGLDDILNDLKDHLKFPNRIVDYVKYLSAYHMDHISTRKTIKKTYTKLREKGIRLRDFILLRYADNKGNVKNYTDFRDTWKSYKECLKVLNEKQPFSVRDLEVNGLDVMEALNLGPCKEVGLVLNKAFEAIQEDIIRNDRDEILKFIKEH